MKLFNPKASLKVQSPKEVTLGDRDSTLEFGVEGEGFFFFLSWGGYIIQSTTHSSQAVPKKEMERNFQIYSMRPELP